jgi:hypothetical protein
MSQSTSRSTVSTSIVLDFVERAGWTAGQQFFAILLTTSTVSSTVGLPWKLALATAAGAAIVSLITTALLYLAKVKDTNYLVDLLVRLAKTFLSSFLGFVGASAFDFLNFDWGSALNVALVATMSAFAKGLLARGPAGGNNNPSTLSAAHYAAATTTRHGLRQKG